MLGYIDTSAQANYAIFLCVKLMTSALSCNLPADLDNACRALVDLLGPVSLDAGLTSAQRLQQLVNQLALLADRSGYELHDSRWKSPTLSHPINNAITFLENAYPIRPLPKTLHTTDQAILIVPGGYLDRIQTRLNITTEAYNTLTNADITVHTVVNILGFRLLSSDEHTTLEQIQQPYPLEAFTEDNMWKTLFTERCKNALPNTNLDTIHSGIYEAFYSNKGLQKLDRSTTFDNAARLALWALDMLKRGTIQPHSTLVLCIEEPYSQRMLLIFKTILSWYIPNPVVAYQPSSYRPTSLIVKKSTTTADLSIPINQLYLRLKLWHGILSHNLCEPRPSVASLTDYSPKK